MLNCRAFQKLPTEEEVADWFGDKLFVVDAVDLLGKVMGLDIEERDKRILVQMSCPEDVEQLLTRMGDDGVEWPRFIDPATNQPIRIKGFSTDRRALLVTLLDVPRDVSNSIIKETMEQYGKVEELKRHHLKKQGMEHISVNRVSLKLMKNEDAELPTAIFGLGSSTSGADRSIWRITYPGAPKRCYRCGFDNHVARDCTKQPITMQQVEKLPAVGDKDPETGQPAPSFPRSYAVVVKSPKFVEEAAEQEKKAQEDNLIKQAKKEQEEKRREEDKIAREALKAEKAEQKKAEDEAKKAAHLSDLARKVEEAALHKKYVKNLHDQAKAEVEEMQTYEKEMVELTDLKSMETNIRLESAEASQPPKRGRSLSSSSTPPLSKKPSPKPQNGSS
jgi:hypothetical protein